jgi:transcription initiation factor TFIIIB Brf1 subunit/transcription initiation factor TFIIB
MENFDIFKLALQEYNKDKQNKQELIKETEIGDKEDKNDKDDKEDKEDKDGCKHSDILDDNGVKICLDCGEEISRDISFDKEWRYYGSEDTRRSGDPNRCHVRKCEEKTIFKDVENLGFSDRIINIANDIYLQVTKGNIFRGNSRKSIVFACVFNAFKMIDKPQSSESLREIFKLDRKTTLKGVKYVNLNAPKDSNLRIKYITPVELIDEIMEKFTATKEQKEEIVKLYEKIRNKSSALNRARPQSVASGLIYFYISNISNPNNSLNIKDFIKKVKLSELTVQKISNEIKRVLLIKGN